jgi:hypothetical protein
MTDLKQKMTRDERLVQARSSTDTPRGLASPRPRAGTLRPRPQIRKLQCSLNNGTLAGRFDNRNSPTGKDRSVAAATSKEKKSTFCRSERTWCAVAGREATVIFSPATNGCPEVAGAVHAGIPQRPPQSQQEHECRFACNGSTGCTCASAVQKTARRSQAKRFMDGPMVAHRSHRRNPIFQSGLHRWRAQGWSSVVAARTNAWISG